MAHQGTLTNPYELIGKAIQQVVHGDPGPLPTPEWKTIVCPGCRGNGWNEGVKLSRICDVCAGSGDRLVLGGTE